MYTIVIFRQVKQLEVGTFPLFMLQKETTTEENLNRLCLPILLKSQIRTTLLLEENLKFPAKSLHLYKKIEKEKIVLFEYKPLLEEEECFLESFTAYSEEDKYQWLLRWEILNTKSCGSLTVTDAIVDLFLFIFTTTSLTIFEEQEQELVRVGYLHDVPQNELGILTLYGVNRELFEDEVSTRTGYHFFLEYKKPDKGMKCVRYAIVDLPDTFLMSAKNDKICLLHYGYHLPLSIS
jgi:hypothetical protein